MNKKIVANVLLALTIFAFTFTPITVVLGQNQNLGVSILQVSPANAISTSGQSTYNGTVGQIFNLQGTLYTSNGSYQVFLSNTVIAQGVSEGLYVNVNFTVPSVPGGSYDLTLRDAAINVNSTGNTPETFLVLTAYAINAIPSPVQEGGSVQLAVSITGGQPNIAYNANVSVVLPSPLSTEYSKIVSLGTSNAQGSANALVTYPDSSFQPSAGLTDYVGTYNIYFNQSTSLASNQFTASFLDSPNYHRGQTLTVKATGYQPNQVATFSVTSASNSTNLNSQTVTASANGVVTATWVIPNNLAIGSYNAMITPQGTVKAIQDSQTFSIPGYSISVNTINLASETVPNILIIAVDPVANTNYNSTSDINGRSNLKLESGVQSLTAFFNGVNVGSSNITVTGDGNFNLQCQLTDLKIIVQNQNGVAMPFVSLAISYTFKPASGGSQTAAETGITDTSGKLVLNSTLPGITYTVNASLYNTVFNSANNTFNNIPAQAFSQIVVVCPNEPLTINVVGNNQEIIPEARIELVELANGLFYSGTTDNAGSLSIEVTFGMYRARIYKDNILINQTDIAVFSNTQQKIRCTLYGIQVLVSVIDFFGSPISNANVTINGPAGERLSAKTQADGKVTFNNVIGGDLQIIAFAPGAENNYQATTVNANQAVSVQIKIDRFIALGSLLIEASSLIAMAVILAVIILFTLVEVLRRRKVKKSTKR